MTRTNDADTQIELESLVSDYVTRRNEALGKTIRLRTNRLAERYRRQLEGLTLKATYNADRIKALGKVVVELRSELEPLMKQVLLRQLVLEIAEQELRDYRDADERLRYERTAKVKTGMYAEPARLVDLLYAEHQIDRGDFAALTPDDVEAIATILKRAQPNAEMT